MCMLGSKTLLFSYNMHLFLLGMHVISATVLVSADKCSFFLLSVSADKY